MTRQLTRRLAAAALALAALVSPALTAAPAQAATVVTGADLLTLLTVGPEQDSETYDRAKFKHWTDPNGDCQNTRAEVLIDETRKAVAFTNPDGCTVAKGLWLSLYDDLYWTAASDVDIDHHVALGETWESGASGWTAAQREAYANDLYAPTLSAMTDNLNMAKGSKDAAEWLPEHRVCSYATRVALVKYRWSLKVDEAERAALAVILDPAKPCGQRLHTLPRVKVAA